MDRLRAEISKDRRNESDYPRQMPCSQQCLDLMLSCSSLQLAKTGGWLLSDEDPAMATATPDLDIDLEFGQHSALAQCPPMLDSYSLMAEPTLSGHRTGGSSYHDLNDRIPRAMATCATAVTHYNTGFYAHSDQQGRTKAFSSGSKSARLVSNKARRSQELWCLAPGCSWPRSFPRQYELRRHMKTQHLIQHSGGDEHFYRCAEPTCNDQHVLWRRRDKFRGHLRRNHPEINVDSHIQASIVRDVSERTQSTTRTSTWNDHDQPPQDVAAAPISLSYRSVDGELSHSVHDSVGSHRLAAEEAFVVNPIPQAARQKLITDMLDRVEGAFGSAGDGDLHAVPPVSSNLLRHNPARPASAPQALRPTAPLINIATRPQSASPSNSANDGGDDRSGDGGSGQWSSRCHASSRCTSFGKRSIASNRPSDNASSDQERSARATTSNKRLRTVESLDPKIFPCVWHTFDRDEDPTRHCRIKYNCVSRLRRHHGCNEHQFYYCTTCFNVFDTEQQRLAHHARNDCRFKCVTEGCVHFDTHPRIQCQHARGRGGNTQLSQWNALFRLARPGDPVPELGLVNDGNISPRMRGPSTPITPSAAAAMGPEGAATQLLTVVNDMLQPSAMMRDGMGTPRSRTLTPSDPLSPNGLLRSRIAELEGLAHLIWQELDSPDDHRALIIRETYGTSMVPATQFPDGASWPENLLARRVRALENHIGQAHREVEATDLNRPFRVETLRDMARRLSVMPSSALAPTASVNTPTPSPSAFHVPPAAGRWDIPPTIAPTVFEDTNEPIGAVTDWAEDFFETLRTPPSLQTPGHDVTTRFDLLSAEERLRYQIGVTAVETRGGTIPSTPRMPAQPPPGFIAQEHTQQRPSLALRQSPSPVYFPFTHHDSQAALPHNTQLEHLPKTDHQRDSTYGTMYSDGYHNLSR